MNTSFFDIFKQGSKTYFYSSVFFPAAVRHDVFILYAFVRKADNFVDAIPQQKDEFSRFVSEYRSALAGIPVDDIVIESFVSLTKRRALDPAWTDAFLSAMKLDLTKKQYATLDETRHYMYGSAEVIGLFMARLLDLPPESHHAAQMQGRAMQYINFIRDISEDLQLGRTYLPLADSGLDSLDHAHTIQRPDRFIKFIRRQITIYREWQAEATEGYHYIRKRYLIPIKTAAEMYGWTAEQIDRDPFIVYRVKVKPAIPRILGRIAANTIVPV